MAELTFQAAGETMERAADRTVEKACGGSRRSGQGTRLSQIARGARLGAQTRDPGPGARNLDQRAIGGWADKVGVGAEISRLRSRRHRRSHPGRT
jgi:hypothetical protein